MVAALTVASAALLGLSLLSLPRGLHVLSRLVAPMNGFPISIIFMDFTIRLVLLSFETLQEVLPGGHSRKGISEKRQENHYIGGAGNTSAI